MNVYGCWFPPDWGNGAPLTGGLCTHRGSAPPRGGGGIYLIALPTFISFRAFPGQVERRSSSSFSQGRACHSTLRPVSPLEHHTESYWQLSGQFPSWFLTYLSSVISPPLNSHVSLLIHSSSPQQSRVEARVHSPGGFISVIVFHRKPLLCLLMPRSPIMHSPFVSNGVASWTLELLQQPFGSSLCLVAVLITFLPGLPRRLTSHSNSCTLYFRGHPIREFAVGGGVPVHGPGGSRFVASSMFLFI